jgi:predicted RNA-binding protein with PUA-like domain
MPKTSTNSKSYWLLKSEGSCYSIDDLKADKKTAWTGIRNYQSKNFMVNDMKVGDVVFFYHSQGDTINPTGIYGLASVCSKPHPDETQFDKRDEHFDPKATEEKPIWHCVDIKFVKKLKNPITLAQIKFDPKLEGMRVREVGSRLSVQPVSEKHGEYLLGLVG